jgi:hypothetical protein
MALPTESNLTSAGTTNAQMKTYLAGLRNFIANLLGETETVGDARVALGAGTVGDALFTAETVAEAMAAIPIVSADVVDATGMTAVDFTSIPSTAKKITVNYVALGTNGTSDVILQLGDAGGVETTGYSGGVSRTSASVAAANHSSGFLHANSWDGAFVMHGIAVLTLIDPDTNTWAYSFTGSLSSAAATFSASGSKSLSATLDRIRVTTAGGTQTFDTGTKINILI